VLVTTVKVGFESVSSQHTGIEVSRASLDASRDYAKRFRGMAAVR